MEKERQDSADFKLTRPWVNLEYLSENTNFYGMYFWNTYMITNWRIGSKSATSVFLSTAECKVDDDCTNNTYTSPPFSRPFCKPGSNNKYCGNYFFFINLAGVLSWSFWFNDSSMYKCQRGDDLCHQCQVQERHVSMPLRQTWASQGDSPIKQHWWVQ